jgi:hypothetical protein
MESHFDTVLGRNDLRVGQDEFQHEIRVRIMNNEMRNFLPVFHFEMLNILTSRRVRVPLLFRSSNAYRVHWDDRAYRLVQSCTMGKK